ncbi:hypothetical protein [Caenispirillum bisanense]|uniref:hypothetical protein n=1 Tax=Caenispirillum bisanense TaxID=414052 RepID=UPI0031E35624
MDETRLTGKLPNLDVEIVSRRGDGAAGETVTITFTATPDLATAAAGLLTNPAALLAGLPGAHPVTWWMGMAQAAWQPWINLMQANPFLQPLPRRRR